MENLREVYEKAILSKKIYLILFNKNIRKLFCDDAILNYKLYYCSGKSLGINVDEKLIVFGKEIGYDIVDVINIDRDDISTEDEVNWINSGALIKINEIETLRDVLKLVDEGRIKVRNGFDD